MDVIVPRVNEDVQHAAAGKAAPGFRIDRTTVVWHVAQGKRPADITEARAVAQAHVQAAPPLIPVCGHRYLPGRPDESGNPVFSVYQTDIIIYGQDLANYLENEFSYYFGTPDYVIREPLRKIEFWTMLVEHNEQPPA